jgi:hypothetical protein
MYPMAQYVEVVAAMISRMQATRVCTIGHGARTGEELVACLARQLGHGSWMRVKVAASKPRAAGNA